jgi:hypothetical protein
MRCLLGVPLTALLLGAPLFGVFAWTVYREVTAPPPAADANAVDRYHLAPLLAGVGALVVTLAAAAALRWRWAPYNTCLLDSAAYRARYGELEFDVAPATRDAGPGFKLFNTAGLPRDGVAGIERAVEARLAGAPVSVRFDAGAVRRAAQRELLRRPVRMRVMELIDRAAHKDGPPAAGASLAWGVAGGAASAVSFAGWLLRTALSALPLLLLIAVVVGVVGAVSGAIAAAHQAAAEVAALTHG